MNTFSISKTKSLIALNQIKHLLTGDLSIIRNFVLKITSITSDTSIHSIYDKKINIYKDINNYENTNNSNNNDKKNTTNNNNNDNNNNNNSNDNNVDNKCSDSNNRKSQFDGLPSN